MVRKLKVVIIDREPRLASDWAEALKLRGHDCRWTRDPNEALDWAVNEDIDVVISEIDLEPISGYELAQRIREKKVTKPEIIFVSAQSRISLFDCHQAGASHLLMKPIQISDIDNLLKLLQTQKPQPSAAPRPVAARASQCKTEVSNLGRGGFFLKTTNLPGARPRLEVGKIVDFDIKLSMVPDYHVKGQGIVRWSYDTLLGESGYGVEFVSVSENAQEVIGAFVDLFKVSEFIPRS